MKNNLKFHLMSALCCVALVNTQGHSMNYNNQYMPFNNLQNMNNNNQNIMNNNDKPNKGLQNVGATCYMNATLQCFASVPKLVNALGNYKIQIYQRLSNTTKDNYDLLNTYYFIDLLQDMNSTKSSDNTQNFIVPDNFRSSLAQANPLFKQGQANDSKDLLLHLIEHNHKNLNVQYNISQNLQSDQLDYNITYQSAMQYFKAQNNSPMSQLFYHTANNMMVCQNCQTRTHNVQIGSLLFFPIEEVRKYRDGLNNPNNVLNRTKIVSIFDCFDYYERQAEMSGDNQIYCNYCNTNANSIQQTKLVDSPEYLFINLNRGKDLMYDVQYQTQEIVDLGKYFFNNSENCKYRLLGAVVHMGESGDAGHFIAYTKKTPNAQWYKYNDAFVDEAKPQEINNLLNGEMRSYILLYERIDNNTYNSMIQNAINNNQQLNNQQQFNNNNQYLNPNSNMNYNNVMYNQQMYNNNQNFNNNYQHYNNNQNVYQQQFNNYNQYPNSNNQNMVQNQMNNMYYWNMQNQNMNQQQQFYNNPNVIKNTPQYNSNMPQQNIMYNMNNINQYKNNYNQKQTQNINPNNLEVYKKQQNNSQREKYKKKVQDITKLVDSVKSDPNLVTGLQNLGTTCYMNVVLQCLYHIPELTKYLLDNAKNILDSMVDQKYSETKKYWDETNKKEISITDMPVKNQLMIEYINLIANLASKNNKFKNFYCYAPQDWAAVLSLNNPNFTVTSPSDAFDLMQFEIMPTLRQVLTKPRDKNASSIDSDQTNKDLAKITCLHSYFAADLDSPISKLFDGLEYTETCCKICQTKTFNFQPFNSLSFPMKAVMEYCKPQEYTSLFKKNNDGIFEQINVPTINLEECFKYKEKNQVFEQNQTYCKKCKQNTDATTKNKISVFPNNLIIHCNREKDNDFKCKVSAPATLDLSHYEDESNEQPVLYDLESIIVHVGPSNEEGHFIAYCKNKEGWYKYSDVNVNSVDNSAMVEIMKDGYQAGTEIEHSNYIYMYKRRNDSKMNQVTDSYLKYFDNNENFIKNQTNHLKQFQDLPCDLNHDMIFKNKTVDQFNDKKETSKIINYITTYQNKQDLYDRLKNKIKLNMNVIDYINKALQLKDKDFTLALGEENNRKQFKNIWISKELISTINTVSDMSYYVNNLFQETLEFYATHKNNIEQHQSTFNQIQDIWNAVLHRMQVLGEITGESCLFTNTVAIINVLLPCLDAITKK